MQIQIPPLTKVPTTETESERSEKLDNERVLLNGPMAPSSKFQWAIQKINGPYHKPNGLFFTYYLTFVK
jgi:hypothetical protein